MIYKYSYVLCRIIADLQNYKNDCYYQSFSGKNLHTSTRQGCIGRWYRGLGLYSRRGDGAYS